MELKKGDRVRIYTCKGEDHEETGSRTGKRYEVVYWNLDTAVWKKHGSKVKLMKYGDSKKWGLIDRIETHALSMNVLDMVILVKGNYDGVVKGSVISLHFSKMNK